MSQPPTTPVKVPSTAASYTPATLDPDLRSQINTLLIKDGHVTQIQDTLLHALHSHSSNWPTTIRAHALNLLRSGEVTTYPDLLRRVIDDVRNDTDSAPAATNGSNGETKKVNGESKNGGSTAAAGTSEAKSLAIPQTVVEEALRVTRESLEAVCEVDENGTV